MTRINNSVTSNLYNIVFFVCVPRPKNIRVVKKISKIVLGLEAVPRIRGLPTTGGYYIY